MASMLVAEKELTATQIQFLMEDPPLTIGARIDYEDPDGEFGISQSQLDEFLSECADGARASCCGRYLSECDCECSGCGRAPRHCGCE